LLSYSSVCKFSSLMEVESSIFLREIELLAYYTLPMLLPEEV
jgi:hypothetical protein